MHFINLPAAARLEGVISMESEPNAVRAYFNEIADLWDNVNHCDAKKLELIVKLSGIQNGDAVLDLACGTGILTDHLLKITPRVVGLDLAEKMILHAKEKFAGTSAVFLSCDFYKFTGGPFDAVFLHNAYPHFQDKEALIRCLSRTLRTGGRIVVAHSIGREHLNRVHTGGVGNISVPLRPAAKEASVFSKAFRMDVILDEPEFYCFSGLKR